LKIYKEDCYLRASTILKKRRKKERILATRVSKSLLNHNKVNDVDNQYTRYMNGIQVGIVVLCVTTILMMKNKKK